MNVYNDPQAISLIVKNEGPSTQRYVYLRASYHRHYAAKSTSDLIKVSVSVTAGRPGGAKGIVGPSPNTVGLKTGNLTFDIFLPLLDDPFFDHQSITKGDSLSLVKKVLSFVHRK